MKRWFSGGALGLALLGAVAADCCDPRHDGYVAAQASYKICVERGGVPLTEPLLDEGGHTFQVMKQCAFQGQPLMLEKR